MNQSHRSQSVPQSGQQFRNVFKLTRPEFGLLKSQFDGQLNRELSPKIRSMTLAMFERLTGQPHPTQADFRVYGFYSEAQAAVHGTKIWLDSQGREYEVSHVSYLNEPPAEFAADASAVGVLVRFHDNGRKSLAVQAREAEKVLRAKNHHNLQPVELAFEAAAHHS
jgi:hypothetical protein